MEEIEEGIGHPSDTTFNTLKTKSLAAKNELALYRAELTRLFSQIPSNPLKYNYLETDPLLNEIQEIKRKISSKNNELMEILRIERILKTNYPTENQDL